MSYANVVRGTISAMAPNSQTNRRSNNNNATSSDNSQSQNDTQHIDNKSHPLYLHNNDQPGMILISKKLLGSENYASWKRSMQIALSAKNKLVIVTGDFVAPAESSPLFVHWKRVNDMVITWILNTVSDDISNSMTYLDNAFTVWSELSERFSAVTGHKFYETQRDLFKLEQGNDSVEFYFHKLKGFWDELRALSPTVKCTCGATKDWEEQIEKTGLIQFLMGLYSSYTAARGQLLMMSPWPTVNQAFMLLKQEERQRQTQNSFASPVAMMVNMSKSVQAGSSYAQNRFSDRPSNSIPECSHCHYRGHTKEKCYKLHGYPTDHPNHPNNKGKRKISNPRFFNPAAAMQVSQHQSNQPDQTSTDHHLTSEIDALQSQLDSLMKCFNNQASGSDSSISGPAVSTPYSMATHIAGIYLHQHKFILDMLIETGLKNCKPLSLPVEVTVKLSPTYVNSCRLLVYLIC
ncbi:uncharacterized protein LOC141672671 isoform X2 [Apium graveolens]|uniref:uncharacterized protein LOC141672671 isoform X2 n=1 Tax=Apium graveolens TaxID=4045 RepID=UPI003D7A35CF